MNRESSSKKKRFVERLSVLDCGLVVCYAIMLTLIALRAYPVWDDGWLQLLRNETAGSFTAWRVRPFELYLVHGLVRRGWLVALGVVTHLVGWSALGLASYGFWRLLFPDRRSDALLAAGLCMAPLLVSIQVNLVVVPSSVMLSTVLVYAATFLILVAWPAGRPFRRAGLVAAFGLLLGGCLLSEYAVPAGLACAVILAAVLKPARDSTLSRRWPVALFTLMLLAGYMAYWLLSSGLERQGVRPEQQWQAQGLLYGLGVTMVRLGSSFWQGAIGYLFAEIGALTVQQRPAQALALVPGVLAGWGLHRRVRHRGTMAAMEHNPGVRVPLPILAGALLLGLGPIVFMRQLSHPNRFWLPLLPVTACLSLRALQTILRKRWMRWIPWVLGILFVQSTVMLYRGSIDDGEIVRDWGRQLRPELAEAGLTVAVLMTPNAVRRGIPEDGFHTRLLEEGEDYWLTAVLAHDWTGEETARFWAFGSWHQASAFLSGVIPGDALQGPTIERHIRGVVREGAVKRFLWLFTDSDADLRIIRQDCHVPL